MARSKVKSRSDHDVAHLHPLTNVSTKYQLPTIYGFWDTAWTSFFPPPAHPSRHHGWKQYPDPMGKKVVSPFSGAMLNVCLKSNNAFMSEMVWDMVVQLQAGKSLSCELFFSWTNNLSMFVFYSFPGNAYRNPIWIIRCSVEMQTGIKRGKE